MQYFTILWVSHNCDVAHGVPVYSNDSFDIYEVVSRCVVADRSQPHTFTLEELNAAYEAMHRLGEHDRQDFLLEQCRNPESVLLQFDLLALISTDRQDDIRDGNQFLVTLVLGDERFRYDARDFWVILR